MEIIPDDDSSIFHALTFGSLNPAIHSLSNDLKTIRIFYQVFSFTSHQLSSSCIPLVPLHISSHDTTYPAVPTPTPNALSGLLAPQAQPAPLPTGV